VIVKKNPTVSYYPLIMFVNCNDYFVIFGYILYVQYHPIVMLTYQAIYGNLVGHRTMSCKT